VSGRSLTKLSELRRQLRTGELEAKLAERSGAPAALRQYSIDPSGTDALIKFGKHSGLQLSHIAQRDPGYLNWILESDFPSELKDVTREVLARRDGGEMSKAAEELAASFKGLGRKAGMTAAAAGELAEKLAKHATRKKK